MSRAVTLASIYALIGVCFGGLALYLRGDIWTHPNPWLQLGTWSSHAYSGLLGLTLGIGGAALTLTLVRRYSWAAQLHEELRPVATGLSGPAVVVLALFSSLGEEILFRSVLQTSTNVFIQALVFGIAHQLPGRARWTWALWAMMMGLLLGVLFQATGSLVGPLVAHATINGMNLRFLKRHQARKQPRRIEGGILGQRI